MKKILLSIILLFACKINAQMLYQLDTFQAPYVEMTSGTNVSSAAWDSSQMVTLPFGFKYFDKMYNNLYITNYGVYFSDTGLDMIYYGLDDFIAEDLDINLSPITFDITGDIGSRIVKVQYKNINEANTDTSKIYALNLQIWLYESNNNIEMRFGNSVVNDPQYTRFDMGLDNEDGNHMYGISGSANNPSLVVVDGNFTGISSFPSINTVYRFKPKNWSSVYAFNKEKYQFGMTGDGFIFKDDSKVELKVLDINGKLLASYSYDNQEGLQQYVLNYLNGIYILEIHSENSIFYEKILIGQ